MAPPVDPEAPLGRTVTGAPRKSRAGRKPGSTTAPKSPAPAPPPKKAGTRPPAAKKRNYAATIEAGLALSLNLTKYPAVRPFSGDIAVLYLERKTLGQVGNEGIHRAINRWPKLQEVIDKLTKFGPGAVLGGGAVVPILAQLAHNHHMLPPALVGLFNPIGPEEIQARLQADMVRQMRAAGLDPDQMREAAATAFNEQERATAETLDRLQHEPAHAGA